MHHFNYELLLQALIASPTPFQVKVTDGTVQITSDSEDNIVAIQEKLKACLSSSAQLQDTLKYNFTTGAVTSTTHSTVTTVSRDIPDITIESTQTLIASLISENVLFDNGIHIKGILNQKGILKDGTVFSREIKDENIANAWKNQIEYLMRFFDNVTVEQIRDALENEDHFLKEPEVQSLGSTQKAFGRGLLQECFGSQEFENPKRMVAYFNVKRFWQFLYPPKLEIQQADENTYVLTIDEEHFIAHLKSLVQGSVLLKVFKDDEQHDFALPISLGLEPSARKQISYCLVLDTSSSMASHNGIGTLKDQAIHFIQKLHQACLNKHETGDDVFVKLIFFADDVRDSEELPISQYQTLIETIRNQRADGSTELYGAIKAAFKDIQNRQLTRHRRHTVILFTDGEHTKGDFSAAKVQLEKALSNFLSAGLELPHFYTFGYANADTAELQTLSNLTHSRCTVLPKLDDFAQILNDYAPEMQTQREIVEILGSLDGNRQIFHIPVYGNIGPQLPTVVIPLQGPHPLTITQEDRQLTITFNPHDIPAMDLHTHLSKISADIETALRNPDFQRKAIALQAARTQLEKLRSQVTHASDTVQAFYGNLQLKIRPHFSGSSSSAPVQTLLLSTTVTQQNQTSTRTFTLT